MKTGAFVKLMNDAERMREKTERVAKGGLLSDITQEDVVTLHSALGFLLALVNESEVEVNA